MKLKKIQLNGFKSFGEKTEIDFENNLNGIVGPNGSGKSNIIDAIKWVLGQQKSSDLRTKTNIDVIFSGSEKKKPKNVAEVTLVFDNSDRYLDIDFSEVSFKRRLFRNGDNEYFLNGSKCRLKDINNLIMDKGFGKDSFSIISQGKVEEIIMSKPEKRREMIDEVAGIKKYRVKKNTVNRKLERLDVNLEKISFIVDEINSNLEPLKEAAKKATLYKDYKEELTKKEKTLLANSIQISSEDLKHVEEEFFEVKKEVSTNNKNISSIEKELFLIDEKISNLQSEISELNNFINVKANDEMILENKIALIAEKNKMYEDTDDSIRIEQLSKVIKDLKIEKNQLEVKNSEITPIKNSLFDNINKLKQDNQINKTKLYELKKEEEQLKFMQSKNSYPFAVKKVLELANKNILGTIKDNINIYVGYELAISTILGNRKNEIITVDETVVKDAINYLKNNKLGKATFSPINKVKPRFIDNQTKELLNSNKDLFLGIAIDFVECDNQYKNVISSVLGNVLVCKDIEQANKLNKLLNSKYQIITLEGDVFLTSGKISGGYDKNISIANVEKKLSAIIMNINEMEEKISVDEKELETSSREFMEVKIELDININKLEKINSELKEVNMEYNSLMQKDTSKGNLNVLDFEEELEKIKKEKLEILSNKNEKQNELKINLESKTQINSNLVSLRADYKTLSSKEAHLEVRTIQLKDKIKLLIEELSEKYNISFKAAYENSLKLDSLEEYTQDVKILKSKIQSLGFINEEAVVEYEKQKEKYDYYYNQKEDLEASKEKILLVLEKLDNFVVEKFDDAFAKLNVEFKQIFSQLFDGGNATLVLTEPNDLLNTGVEIIAQPPGKKSQVIGLLSGGEKALTAISLLFAILRVRVVPFAILDEVEAALDEANVIRYIEYLKVFSLNTQFLIITHRQSTMEKVDKLYGITMVEKGVSSVLDIDLKNMNNNQEISEI